MLGGQSLSPGPKEDRFLLFFSEECPSDATKRDPPGARWQEGIDLPAPGAVQCIFLWVPRLSLEVVPALCRSRGSTHTCLSPTGRQHTQGRRIWGEEQMTDQLVFCLSRFKRGMTGVENVAAGGGCGERPWLRRAS